MWPCYEKNNCQLSEIIRCYLYHISFSESRTFAGIRGNIDTLMECILAVRLKSIDAIVLQPHSSPPFSLSSPVPHLLDSRALVTLKCTDVDDLQIVCDFQHPGSLITSQTLKVLSLITL